MLSGYFMFLHVPRWLLHVASVHWFQRCSMIFQFSMIFHVLVCFDLMFQIWGRGPSESHLLAGQICKPNNASRLFGHLIISVSVTALGKVLRPIPPASFSRTAPMVGCWRLWFHAPPRKRTSVYIFNLFLHNICITCIYLNKCTYIFLFVHISIYIYVHIKSYYVIFTLLPNKWNCWKFIFHPQRSRFPLSIWHGTCLKAGGDGAICHCHERWIRLLRKVSFTERIWVIFFLNWKYLLIQKTIKHKEASAMCGFKPCADMISAKWEVEKVLQCSRRRIDSFYQDLTMTMATMVVAKSWKQDHVSWDIS